MRLNAFSERVLISFLLNDLIYILSFKFLLLVFGWFETILDGISQVCQSFLFRNHDSKVNQNHKF